MGVGYRIVTSFTALLLAAAYSLPLHAQAPTAVQPVKRHPGVGSDPFSTAQIQIERLRQTASKLRLLSEQPVSSNSAESDRSEFADHKQWLRQAEQRVNGLARQWEDQLKPLNNRNTLAPVLNLNAFFESQSATLQAKLRRESLAQAPGSERVRSSGVTARLVISKMF
ncbi:MAG: hypothetical protein A2W18_09790 [Candidatus Muproteobacteria bacterium RBG_16_60_9]|uniref:Uncharacterized protein n=1 Tax=Candidatus Muproteobacteria bacterium RBG_16_60_9 TaxID=1817755 RepID=A0A1F6VAK9_9PROT|nr:MAG: hypothetical protein A2W18_09790 [Candidatus Muproteobacteria bacterium RBG_16_60_9]